jgi:hypothetical protein
MPKDQNQPESQPEIKVVIQNPEGKYLAGNAANWFFTDNRSSALIFDYHADRVQEQLDVILQQRGLALSAEPVPLSEIYESCDRCKELFMPSMITFDGKRFFCPDCRKLVARARLRPTPKA